MPIDFRKKYAKYKNKYMKMKYYGGLQNGGSDEVPIIELYEFDLQDYERNKKYRFLDLKKAESGCGKIQIKG